MQEIVRDLRTLKESLACELAANPATPAPSKTMGLVNMWAFTVVMALLSIFVIVIERHQHEQNQKLESKSK